MVTSNYNLRKKGPQCVEDTWTSCKQSRNTLVQWLVTNAQSKSPEEALKKFYNPHKTTSRIAALATLGGLTLYTIGIDSAKAALKHGFQWWALSSFNKAALPEESSSTPINYLTSIFKDRETAQAARFELHTNIALASVAALGTAYVVRSIYNKYMK